MAFVSAVRQRVGDACLIQAERQVCGWTCAPARASEAFGEPILSESGPLHFTSPSILLPAQQDMLSKTGGMGLPTGYIDANRCGSHSKYFFLNDKSSRGDLFLGGLVWARGWRFGRGLLYGFTTRSAKRPMVKDAEEVAEPDDPEPRWPAL